MGDTILFVLVITGIVAILILSNLIVDAIKTVKLAAVLGTSEKGCVKHDLEEYTRWIAEKGVIVGGFRVHSLVNDYLSDKDE